MKSRGLQVIRIKRVGPARFELATSSTPRKRATKLRYGPSMMPIKYDQNRQEGHFATFGASGKLRKRKA